MRRHTRHAKRNNNKRPNHNSTISAHCNAYIVLLSNTFLSIKRTVIYVHFVKDCVQHDKHTIIVESSYFDTTVKHAVRPAHNALPHK